MKVSFLIYNPKIKHQPSTVSIRINCGTCTDALELSHIRLKNIWPRLKVTIYMVRLPDIKPTLIPPKRSMSSIYKTHLHDYDERYKKQPQAPGIPILFRAFNKNAIVTNTRTDKIRISGTCGNNSINALFNLTSLINIEMELELSHIILLCSLIRQNKKYSKLRIFWKSTNE